MNLNKGIIKYTKYFFQALKRNSITVLIKEMHSYHILLIFAPAQMHIFLDF